MTVLDWITVALIEVIAVGVILWGVMDWWENRR